jgi:hypothetical protein
VHLWIYSTDRRANGPTSWALLGVNLQKIESPKKMLWATLLEEEGDPLEKITEDLHNVHTFTNELAEVRDC